MPKSAPHAQRQQGIGVQRICGLTPINYCCVANEYIITACGAFIYGVELSTVCPTSCSLYRTTLTVAHGLCSMAMPKATYIMMRLATLCEAKTYKIISRFGTSLHSITEVAMQI